ncbi:MAG TPA: GDSL-type esterase/lipase family protein [Opitutaceae bacterium]|nr:GDSL-type esterase/lipase family protein [Opitutaceae bacterium]
MKPLACLLAAAALAGAARAGEPLDLRYSFGARAEEGAVRVAPADAYNVDRTYGFDLGSAVAAGDGFVAGRDGRPFFFSSRLGPGAYRVTVTLGDPAAESVATVKSETRRLMLEAVRVPAGRTRSFTFLVHLRDPRLPGGGLVRLKAREKEPILWVQWDPGDPSTRQPFVELDWDEKLTLEFSGAHPALRQIEIAPARHPVTVYLIGDSTVTDQMMGPWGAWGQQLPRWFKPPVLIANYAESGETAESFIGELRWRKLLSEIHPGDYVLMQFGINDQRQPVEKFKSFFPRFIADTRAHGATPVLVSSQNLRRLGPDGKAVPTLRGFPEAMRQAAAENHAAFIDLNAMSLRLYTAWGPERIARAFVDGTHQNMYGSYELSKCVVMGILADRLPFAEGNLADDWKPFDPSHPDPVEDFRLPPDPQLDPARPGGPGAPDHRGPMAGDVRRGPAAGPVQGPPAPEGLAPPGVQHP